MKKLAAATAALLLLVSLCSCGAQPKIEGNYADVNDDVRFVFTLQDGVSGEYGGSCEMYNNGKLERTDGWTVTDDVVSLNGAPVFVRAGDYLLYLDSRCDGVTTNKNGLSGTIAADTIRPGEFMRLLYSPNITFHGGGACEAVTDVAVVLSRTVSGTYTIENGLVHLHFPDSPNLDHTCLLLNGTLYYNGLHKA